MLSIAAHWERLAEDRLELIRNHPDFAKGGEPEEGGAR